MFSPRLLSSRGQRCRHVHIRRLPDAQIQCVGRQFRYDIRAQRNRRVFSTSTSQKTVASASRIAVAVTLFGAGFIAGRCFTPIDQSTKNASVLPNGLPRTCCDPPATPPLTEAQFHLSTRLRRIVGAENVHDGLRLDTVTAPFLTPARVGSGSSPAAALCIVTPRRLHHVADIVEAALAANCVVLVQGQNTGLTGGSVPRPCQNDHHSHSDKKDDSAKSHRPVVVLSLKYLDAIFPIDDGKRVVCFAGVGLASLEQFLKTNFPDRESHSVLGSTFLNPTTAAGVALGSGGTQCRKGPAYTERALYLKVTTNKWHEKVVEAVNTLDIEGMDDRDDLLPGRARKHMDSVAYRLDTWGRWIQEGYERTMKYSHDDRALSSEQNASDVKYAAKLCRHDSRSVSRYNADTSGPELCRSEGKVIILATVHDTFPKPISTKTFWLSFDSLDTALQFRKAVALVSPHDLPISMEYMDRDAFDVVDQAGRALGNTIKMVGTTSPIVRRLWNVKLWIEALPYVGADVFVDKLLYRINGFLPGILPGPIMKMGTSSDHHVVMTVGDFGDGSMNRTLDRLHKFVDETGGEKIKVYECVSPKESMSLTAFRFVAAPAFRTWCVGQGLQGYSVDYALPKSGGNVPPLHGLDQTDRDVSVPVKRMRYSHFACNVVHEDLAYAAGVDITKAKHALKSIIEQKCGGKLPAEHGHGTEYVAPLETRERWKKMDPLNVLNPGIGGLSEKYRYEE